MNKERKDDPKPKPPPAPQLPNLPWSPDDPFQLDPERKEPVTTSLPETEKENDGATPPARPKRERRENEESNEQ